MGPYDYPETTKVGWMNLDTFSIMKDQDPVSWSCAKSEWESQGAVDGTEDLLAGKALNWYPIVAIN